MSANVLNTSRAAEVSVYVVRAFVRLRQMAGMNAAMAEKLAELERRVTGHDEAIRSLVQTIRQLMAPPAKPRRVPTRVGMVRATFAPSWRRGGVPHARGDGPPRASSAGSPETCSPRAGAWIETKSPRPCTGRNARARPSPRIPHRALPRTVRSRLECCLSYAPHSNLETRGLSSSRPAFSGHLLA